MSNQTKKKTPRPEDEAKKAQFKEARSRVSLFGNTYPESHPCEWSQWIISNEPKWVHTSESDKFFASHYQSLTGIYWPSEGPVCQDQHGGQLHPSEQGGFETCAMSGCFIPTANMVDVFNSDGVPIRVSSISRDDHFFHCDFSDRFYPNSSRVNIRGSQKYKRIFKAVVAKTGNPFGKCGICGEWHENASLTHDVDLNKISCMPCLDNYKYKDVIHAHDYDGYPPAIFSEILRYGHTVKDGVIYATNKKEKVDTKTRRLFGVEVETEMSRRMLALDNLRRRWVAHNIREALGKDFVVIKEDGTLRTNGHYSEHMGQMYAGIEIVSAPADIIAHRKYWAKLSGCKAYRYLRAWNTETCGFHVHVSRSSLTTLQIGRMLVFINHPKNKKFVHEVAGRSESRYTKYLPKELTDAAHPERVVSPDEQKPRDRARRVALNISNPKTVEFRIFRGTVNPRHIIRNVEFCDAVCDFCYPASRSIKELGDKDCFVKFVDKNRKRWPLLAEWLVAHGLITAPLINGNVKPELLTLRPDLLQKELGEESSAEPADVDGPPEPAGKLVGEVHPADSMLTYATPTPMVATTFKPTSKVKIAMMPANGPTINPDWVATGSAGAGGTYGSYGTGELAGFKSVVDSNSYAKAKEAVLAQLKKDIGWIAPPQPTIGPAGDVPDMPDEV